MSADEIRHDKNKNYLLQGCNLKFMIKNLHFPRFFHPDPTVKRQTGYLFQDCKKIALPDCYLNYLILQ